MFEQAFKNIDDVLWKEAGCASAQRKHAALEALKKIAAAPSLQRSALGGQWQRQTSCSKVTAMSARSKSKPATSSKFSDFIRNASSAEKKRLYTEVMKKAAARQNATLRAAIAAGVASGTGKSADIVFDQLEAKYRKLAGTRAE